MIINKFVSISLLTSVLLIGCGGPEEKKTFYENGKVKTIGFYEKDKLNGKFLEYSKDGKVVKELNYKDNEIVSGYERTLFSSIDNIGDKNFVMDLKANKWGQTFNFHGQIDTLPDFLKEIKYENGKKLGYEYYYEKADKKVQTININTSNRIKLKNKYLLKVKEITSTQVTNCNKFWGCGNIDVAMNAIKVNVKNIGFLESVTSEQVLYALENGWNPKEKELIDVLKKVTDTSLKLEKELLKGQVVFVVFLPKVTPETESKLLSINSGYSDYINYKERIEANKKTEEIFKKLRKESNKKLNKDMSYEDSIKYSGNLVNQLSNEDFTYLAKSIQASSLAKLIKYFSDEKKLILLNYKPRYIDKIKNPTEEMQLIAVKQDGIAIRDIKNPTEEMQLIAVKQDGIAIRDIKNPTEEMQLIAVKQNGELIEYIKNPSKKVQLASIKENNKHIDENQIEAIIKEPKLIKNIKNLSERDFYVLIRRRSAVVNYFSEKDILKVLDSPSIDGGHAYDIGTSMIRHNKITEKTLLKVLDKIAYMTTPGIDTNKYKSTHTIDKELEKLKAEIYGK